jgi:hypothetical protein
MHYMSYETHTHVRHNAHGMFKYVYMISRQRPTIEPGNRDGGAAERRSVQAMLEYYAAVLRRRVEEALPIVFTTRNSTPPRGV